MKTSAIILAGAIMVAAAQPEPKFARDWQSVVMQHVVINQGGITNKDGSVTCPAEAPECKVQTAYGGFMQYNSATTAQAKLANPDSSGVVVDCTVKKEYSVDANGNCQSWCPTTQAGGCPITAFQIGPNATYEGVATGSPYCSGKPCVDWRIVQQPFFNITFETDDYFIDVTNASNPIPLAEYSDLTPFGMPMGFQQSSYEQYATGPIDPSVFVVNGNATCPQASEKSCEGDDDSGQADLYDRAGDPWTYARFQSFRRGDGLVLQSIRNYQARVAKANQRKL